MRLQIQQQGRWRDLLIFDMADTQQVKACVSRLGVCAFVAGDPTSFRLVDDYEDVTDVWTPKQGWRTPATV